MRSSPRETLSQTTSTFASLAPSKFSSQIQRRSAKGGANGAVDGRNPAPPGM